LLNFSKKRTQKKHDKNDSPKSKQKEPSNIQDDDDWLDAPPKIPSKYAQMSLSEIQTLLNKVDEKVEKIHLFQKRLKDDKDFLIKLLKKRKG